MDMLWLHLLPYGSAAEPVVAEGARPLPALREVIV
jgi:hypothetical protein